MPVSDGSTRVGSITQPPSPEAGWGLIDEQGHASRDEDARPTSSKSRAVGRTAAGSARPSTPRILVISNNPFSDISNNGKTLASFFMEYPESSLAQFYFSELPPSAAPCTNFFKGSDRDVLRSLVRRAARTGDRKQGSPNPGQTLCSGLVRMLTASPGDLARLAREALWATGAWRTNDLDAWLDDFHPELVFFMAGDSLFAYEMVDYVVRRCGAKLCVYVTDDYVLPRSRLSPLWWIRRSMVSRRLRGAIQDSILLLTISEEMRSAYRQKYGRDSILAVNAPGRMHAQPMGSSEVGSRPLVLAYTGGLHFNRAATLARLGHALHEFNLAHAQGNGAVLRVYSSQRPSARDLAVMSLPGAIEFSGSLDSDGVTKVLAEADVLVHVESFDRKSREATRLSVSTKIPEYLSHGKPIIAIGPQGVASMNYLAGVAVCVTNPTELRPILDRLLTDPAKRAAMSSLAAERFDTQLAASRNVLPSVIAAYRETQNCPR